LIVAVFGFNAQNTPFRWGATGHLLRISRPYNPALIGVRAALSHARTTASRLFDRTPGLQDANQDRLARPCRKDSSSAAANPHLMPFSMSPTEVLQRHLLRRCVGDLQAERHVCSDCARTPLVGERLYFFDAGEAVCELCRHLRHETPRASQPVRHSEYGHAVRLTVRAAA
jgi:hypothetical protein